MKEGEGFASSDERALPKENPYSFLAAFGNSEAKAITLIAMSDGNIYPLQPLKRKLINLQGEQVGWNISDDVPFKYCKKSLAPDFVEEIFTPDQLTYGYAIKKYGKDFGVPRAGLLLKWSLDHTKYSLYQMFAGTQSTRFKKDGEDKKRAPETRLKIFKFLLANPKSVIREADIAVALGEDRRIIENHLVNLFANGVIHYETVERGQPISRGQKSVIHGKFRTDFKSQVLLSEDQRSAIESLVNLLDGFMKQDQKILKDGRDLAGSIIANPKKVALLMKKAKDTSPFANRISSENLLSSIFIIIKTQPGINTRRIQEEIERTYHKRLSAKRILGLLANLARRRIIEIQKTKSGNAYMTINNS